MNDRSRSWHDGWITAARVAFSGLVVWLVYVLLDDISSLAAQTCLVVGGGLAIVATWHSSRSDPEPKLGDGATPKPPVSSWQRHVAAILLSTPVVIESVLRLQGHDVGERSWWVGVIGLSSWSAGVVYAFVALYQERDARAEQRKEEWAPWG